MLEMEKLNWQRLVDPYARSDLRRSLWQIANTLVPYFILWGMMYWSLGVSYWLTLVLAVPTAGFLVRAFIIFHDCCHGSFFKTRTANETLGVILGVLVLTPYYHWRRDHAIHHATAGNLDKRGVGDVKTWTVQEYVAASWWKRVGYRIMRNPLVMFTIGASLVFLVAHRFWRPHAGRRERMSVVYTDLALLGLFLIIGGWLGYLEILVVQVTIMAVASSAGVWLFYVQHQFEGVYWERKDRWSFVRAGLQGSSFYKLPAILNWFSGNIGFHHIHHLSPKVPNYFLEKCHEKNPALQVKPLTILGSLRSANLRLWDEATQQLVGFDAARKYQPQNIQ